MLSKLNCTRFLGSMLINIKPGCRFIVILSLIANNSAANLIPTPSYCGSNSCKQVEGVVVVVCVVVCDEGCEVGLVYVKDSDRVKKSVG